MISLCLCLAQTQCLEVIGGLTGEVVFPRVDAWLNASSDHQNALLYVADEQKMESYRSMVDYLFCELFVKYRKPCFLYYDDEGPQLREIARQQHLSLIGFEQIMLRALEIAYRAFCEQRQLSWSSFRKQALAA